MSLKRFYENSPLKNPPVNSPRSNSPLVSPPGLFPLVNSYHRELTGGNSPGWNQIGDITQKSRNYKRLLFLSYPLMMNIRNLGSKESVGVNFKQGICAKLCLMLWFESDWYLCNISQVGFERDSPEKSPKQSLPKGRCSSNQVFLKTSHYSQENICVGVTS